MKKATEGQKLAASHTMELNNYNRLEKTITKMINDLGEGNEPVIENLWQAITHVRIARKHRQLTQESERKLFHELQKEIN